MRDDTNEELLFNDDDIITDEEIIEMKDFDDDKYDSFFSLALADRFYSISNYDFKYDEHVEI